MLKTQLSTLSSTLSSRLATISHAICVRRATETPNTTNATSTSTANPRFRRTRMAAETGTQADQPLSGQQAMLAQQRAREQRNAEDQAKAKKSVTYFPMGYKEALSQWWTNLSAPQAERNVLTLVPFLKELSATSATTTTTPDSTTTVTVDPHGKRVWRVQRVALSGKNRELNEYSVHRPDEEAEHTLVMLHGYGAGLGFFYKNFEPLSRPRGWRLFALDMLGMGNSSRPPFRIHAKDQAGKIAEAEGWFVDSLEEWRKIRKIEKMTLLGHSMGGYLAVSYALKYPGHIHKLILASPVGIPEDPFAVNAAMPEPGDSTLASEFAQDQESIINSAPSSGTSTPNSAAKAVPPPEPAAKPQRRPIPSWVAWLWDANISPFSLIRASGPLGPRLVSGWTSRRFNHLPPAESEALHNYAYTLFRQKGSGEYVLPYILAPGAYARSPIINRIAEVGRQMIPLSDDNAAAGVQPKTKRETGYPIVMMYGDNDWMDVAGGLAAEEKLKKRIERELKENKERERGSAKVVIVQKAGHHLYLDNAEEFNGRILREMEETRDQVYRDRINGVA